MLMRHFFFVPMRGSKKETIRLDKSDGRKSKMTNDTTRNRPSPRMPVSCLLEAGLSGGLHWGNPYRRILVFISSVLMPGHGLFRVLRFVFSFLSV